MRLRIRSPKSDGDSATSASEGVSSAKRVRRSARSSLAGQSVEVGPSIHGCAEPPRLHGTASSSGAMSSSGSSRLLPRSPLPSGAPTARAPRSSSSTRTTSQTAPRPPHTSTSFALPRPTTTPRPQRCFLSAGYRRAGPLRHRCPVQPEREHVRPCTRSPAIVPVRSLRWRTVSVQ